MYANILASRFRHLIVGVGAVVALTFAPAFARAADPAADTALVKVPENAEFFSTTLKLGEIFDTLAKSRAWQQIWNQPALQAEWKKAWASYEKGEGEFAPIKKFLADPKNKDLPALLADAASNEIFMYGSNGWSEMLTVFQELGGAQYGAAFAAFQQQLLGGNQEKAQRAQIKAYLKVFAEKPERLRFPDLVIGFKVSDSAKVTAQLKRLDSLIADGLANTPLKGRSERTKVGDDDFLVLKLDGSLIPWDEIPIAMYEDNDGEYAPLVNHLKKMKLSIALGVRQGYLMLAIGESADNLLKFGGTGAKLATRPEMKTLEKFAERKMISASYTSAKLLQPLATTAQDIAGMGDLAKNGLQLAGLPEEQRMAIEKDIDALVKVWSSDITKPGASTSFSFLSPRGYETFAYNYTESKAEAARPLTLLDHLGGDPLLAVVWRSGTKVEQYRALVKWVGIFGGHVERAAVEKFPAAEDAINLFRTEFLPLIKQMSDVTEKSWLPALADGEQAIVLDAKWKSKQWFNKMPEAEKPLSAPEFGIVLGVSDAEKLKEALESYRVITNKVIDKIRDLAPPGNVPEFSIPKPTVEEKGDRTFAHYPIPPFLGFDPKFQPTGAVSPKVATLTLSREHAERLLDSNPLKIDAAPLKDTKRPLDSVFYFNWAGVVDSADPWVDYLAKLGPLAGKDENFGSHADYARKAMGVLKCFRGIVSVTYRENGVTVSHSEVLVRDLEATARK